MRPFQTRLIPRHDDPFDPYAHPRFRPRWALRRDLWRARGHAADPRPGHSARRAVDDDHRCRKLSRLCGDRKSVGEGKRWALRVDLGGRRIIKKKKMNKNNS